MKSIYVYEFTKVHGPTGYLNTSFFTDKDKQKEIMDKANKQKIRRLLPADKFHKMKESIIALTKKYAFVRMDYYGFRSGWKANCNIHPISAYNI